MSTAAPGLPQAVFPFVEFTRLLRRHAFPVAPEQATAFLSAVELLGPKSMEDIRQAGLATLAPPPDRRSEFDALFRLVFFGEAGSVAVDGEEDEEARIRDDHRPEQERREPVRQEEGGALASALDQPGVRSFDEAAEEDELARLRRSLASVLPARRSFRRVRTRTRGQIDLRRSLRAIVQAEGDMPRPERRLRQIVPRRLVLLVDISGSMKLHTGDYLKVAHAAVQAAAHTEVFTFGTRLTRITGCLRPRDEKQALALAAAGVEDWDGGTRIGPALAAFLSNPRFSALARGAAVVVLSDGLERGDHAEMAAAIRRLSMRAHRLSLATPLAGDPRFRPETAALRAILPLLDDLVDSSSVSRLVRFFLSLGRPAPPAAAVWRRQADAQYS
ncbi:MAG: VWA domain-containing protein [Shinella sp.]|nr:VWA domain-containing protein [Shinella sp.]